jgi:hypothetical protein
MPKNEVFANGLEVACKVADGKSVACFPDPCWSPPPPPAGPVVIPYPNTAFAKDLANASKTVFISGKPVAQKNKSYFKTSTGNEPATRAFPMGVITHTIKGKAYFTSWSMDVKVEGFNVCRHMDMMTHNHASRPGNTPPWLYLDSGTNTIKRACTSEQNNAKKQCTPNETEEGEFRKDQKRANKRREKKGQPKKPTRAMGWKDKHCTGIMRIKPYTDIKQAKGGIEDALADVQEAIDNLEDILIEKGREIVKEKAEGVAVRAGAKYVGSLAGGPFAPFLAAASTALTIIDGAYSTVAGAVNVYGAYKDIQGNLTPIEDLLKDAKAQIKTAENGLELLKKEKNGTITDTEKERLKAIKDEVHQKADEMADIQAAQAMTDPCLKALKCILTPYKDPQKLETIAQKPKPRLNGCCPGQTGHHLPPKSYFKNCKNYYKEDKKKTGKNALVVCAEGVDQRSGSHGRLHDAQDIEAASKLEKGKKLENGQFAKDSLSFDNAIAAAIAAHQKTFPNNQCKEACLRAQLNNNKPLKDCKDSMINPVDKEGGLLKRPDENVTIPGR